MQLSFNWLHYCRVFHCVNRWKCIFFFPSFIEHLGDLQPFTFRNNAAMNVLASRCTCPKVSWPYMKDVHIARTYTKGGVNILYVYQAKPPRPNIWIPGTTSYYTTCTFLPHTCIVVVPFDGSDQTGQAKSIPSLGRIVRNAPCDLGKYQIPFKNGYLF